jgi:hypothetical protein
MGIGITEVLPIHRQTYTGGVALWNSKGITNPLNKRDGAP